MKILKYTDPDYQQGIQALINRSDVDLETQDQTVRAILKDIRENRDSALLEYTRRFDLKEYEAEELQVTEEEIRSAYSDLENEQIDALKTASENIRKFHQRQVQESWDYTEDDVTLGQLVHPLQTVGIYVPGGKASYPSSVLMNAIPAKVAGVPNVVMVSPAPDGEMSSASLVAADIAGVDQIFRIGGAQAVGALAYGTATVPKVDKIVGPGNIYVALAKRLVFGIVDIDMIAGPSEILIVADESARPDFVAADLLSQAEHDELAVPILITPSEDLVNRVVEELNVQKQRLNRKAIIEESLSNQCRLILVETMAVAVDLANQVAPEHLELAVDNPKIWWPEIRHAGAIFAGHHTPEAIGDYLAGPNHVLPTSGTARFSSPLGVYDFQKRTSLISYSQDALKKAGKTCTILAEMEELDAHAQAVKIRFKESGKF